MVRQTSSRRGFTLLEAAVSLVALTALSAAGYTGAQQARIEFEHNQNRLVVQNFVSATSTDAASRGQQFNPGILEFYREGQRFQVGGVESVLSQLSDVSATTGQVVAWVSDDLQLISVAMLSNRDRCLQAYTVAGQLSPVSTSRTLPCRPILPDALLIQTPGTVVPAPPAGLIALPGNGQVELSWLPSFEDAAYLAVVEPTSRTCSTLNTSCVVELAPGTYSATVVASNSAGTSRPSTPVEFDVSASPAAPQNLVAQPGAAQVTLLWTLPDDNGAALSGHLIQYHTGQVWVDVEVGVENTATITGLQPELEYIFRVAGVNVWGPGALSQPVTAVIFAAAEPPSLVVEGGDRSLEVTLTEPAAITWPVDGYAVAYRVPGGTWIEELRPQGGSFTISGLQAGTVYEVRARTVSSVGDSDWAGPVEQTTLPAVPALQASYSAGTASLSWDPVTGASSYDVARRLGSGAETVVGSPSGAVFSDTVLPDSTYTYRVRSCNQAGCSAFSPTQSVSTSPSAPIVGTVSSGSQSLSVAFTHAAAGTLTMVQYSTDNGSTWRNRASGTTASPLLITTRSSDNVALSNGATYQVRLRAVNATGAGAASAAVPATPYTTPSAPNLTAATGGDRRIDLSWSAPANGGSPITGYTIRGAQCFNDTLSDLVTVSGSTTSHTWTPPSFTCYKFRVVAVNAAGTSAPSNERQATAWSSTLTAGQYRSPGGFLRSANGSYELYMQGDGNLVIYLNGAAVWASGTQNVNNTLWMSTAQPGSLVMTPNWSTVTWSTFGHCSGYHKSGVRTVLQNDGNLVTYNNSDQALWSRTTGILNQTLC